MPTTAMSPLAERDRRRRRRALDPGRGAAAACGLRQPHDLAHDLADGAMLEEQRAGQPRERSLSATVISTIRSESQPSASSRSTCDDSFHRHAQRRGERCVHHGRDVGFAHGAWRRGHGWRRCALRLRRASRHRSRASNAARAICSSRRRSCDASTGCAAVFEPPSSSTTTSPATRRLEADAGQRVGRHLGLDGALVAMPERLPGITDSRNERAGVLRFVVSTRMRDAARARLPPPSARARTRCGARRRGPARGN